MKLNRTLLRTIEILELLSTSKEGYTLAQLAVLLDSPKSSVFDIMKTLVYKQMVLEDNQLGSTHYKIGLHTFEIGSRYIQDIDFIDVAKNDLISFANKMQATTFLAILDKNQVSYVYKYKSENSIITTANIGTRRSLHCAALGKALIAFASEEEKREAIKHTDFIPHTPYTITSPEAYLKELESVKEKGYAKDERENTLQQIAAAAPIYDHTGAIIAAMSCVGFYEEHICLDDLGLLVKGVAESISLKLGYKEDKKEER